MATLIYLICHFVEPIHWDYDRVAILALLAIEGPQWARLVAYLRRQ